MKDEFDMKFLVYTFATSQQYCVCLKNFMKLEVYKMARI